MTRTFSFLLMTTLLLGPAVAVQASELEDAIKTVDTATDPQVRLKAVQKLGELKDPKGIPALIKALRPTVEDLSKDWFVRKAAVKSLYMIGEPAIDPVREAMKDESEVVRARAIDALSKLRPDDIHEVLLSYLEKDSDWQVRQQCVFAFRDLKDKEAIPALRKAAKDDENGAVRRNAAKVADRLEAGM